MGGAVPPEKFVPDWKKEAKPQTADDHIAFMRGLMKPKKGKRVYDVT